MKQQLLLLEDVDSLGQKGEIVSAKPGYMRNFLLPRGFAVVATPNMLRKQERLRSERAQQAVVDRQESETLAQKIEGISLDINVKVDPEGHMYGSVSANDVVDLFKEKGFELERKNVQLNKPLKITGIHPLVIKLKEGVTARCQLNIIPEGVVLTGIESVVAPIPQEGTPSAEETPAAE
jgi:large subunit ribosomal protein L9